MKSASVNATALEAAIRGVFGDEGYQLVDRAYSLLDAYEHQVRAECAFERESVYREGFADGYECGRDTVLGGPQPAYGDELNQPVPDVIYLPDGALDDSEPELPFE